MFKVDIKKNNVITNSAQFETEEWADLWYEQELLNGSFGEEGSFEYVKTEISDLILAENERREALDYLASTDWYIIREMDSGVPCPQEIKMQRAIARLKV